MKPKGISPTSGALHHTGVGSSGYQTATAAQASHRKKLFSHRDGSNGSQGVAEVRTSANRLLGTSSGLGQTSTKLGLRPSENVNQFKKARNSAQAQISGLQRTVKGETERLATQNTSPKNFTGIGTTGSKLSQKMGPPSVTAKK